MGRVAAAVTIKLETDIIGCGRLTEAAETNLRKSTECSGSWGRKLNCDTNFSTSDALSL